MLGKFFSPSIRKSSKPRNNQLTSSSLEPKSTEDLQNQKKSDKTQNRQKIAINFKNSKQSNSNSLLNLGLGSSRQSQKKRSLVSSPLEEGNMLTPFTLSPFKPISKRWSVFSAVFKKNPERMANLNRRGSIEGGREGGKEEGGREDEGRDRNEGGTREEGGGIQEGRTLEGSGEGGRKDLRRGGRRLNSDLIEGRMNKIRELEGEIGRIKEELYGVLVNMKENLIMDEVKKIHYLLSFLKHLLLIIN